MSRIRRIAPRKCPDCEAQNTLFIDDDRRLTCSLCGYKAPLDEPEQAAPPDPADFHTRWPPSYGTPYTADVGRWAQTKFHSAMDAYQRKQFDDALKSFHEAIEEQPDFLDAHIWIARLSDDPETKREHYSEVLAQMPNHLESVRELMVLNGQLSRAEADRTLYGDEAVVREAQEPVKAQLVELSCSVCGGALTAQSDDEAVRCQFCGHVEDLPGNDRGGAGVNSLAMALLKERGKSVRWKVGSRLLHCDNCGADRIITSRKMKHDCPFCGSDQVIQTDALNSFRQPDGIVPFAVNKQQAAAALNEALSSVTEKLKGLFVNNRVDSVRLTPVYLPFWVFDVVAQIIRTQTVQRSNRTAVSLRAGAQRQEYGDALNNVPYCAVESPPQYITRRLDTYDLTQIIPYNPRRLANISAELYTIDFQEASLAVRKDIGERFRFRHGHDEHGDVQVRVSSLIQQMTFRLILKPVWTATIREADGDIRLGLIHGQTGHVLLGKAQKPNA